MTIFGSVIKIKTVAALVAVILLLVAALALMLSHQNIFLLILGFDAILIGIFMGLKSLYITQYSITSSGLVRFCLQEDTEQDPEEITAIYITNEPIWRQTFTQP